MQLQPYYLAYTYTACGHPPPHTFWSGLCGFGFLVSIKGILNAPAHSDILEDSVLPTLWQQVCVCPRFNMLPAQSQVHKEVVIFWCFSRAVSGL